jgi:adenylylsulfate kinase-like enzyme
MKKKNLEQSDFKLYWFTGQAGAGKTTLAILLKSKLEKQFLNKKFVILDGDEIRELFNNKDYSKEGRLSNVGMVQNCCRFLIKNDIVPIVCMVSPFAEQRKDFCKEVDGVEIFIDCTEIRGREHFHIDYYQKPTSTASEVWIEGKNIITIDTTNKKPNQSFKKLWKQLS